MTMSEFNSSIIEIVTISNMAQQMSRVNQFNLVTIKLRRVTST